jgi:hypothetical protein
MTVVSSGTPLTLPTVTSKVGTRETAITTPMKAEMNPVTYSLTSTVAILLTSQFEDTEFYLAVRGYKEAI